MIAPVLLVISLSVTPQDAYSSASSTCAAFPIRSTGTTYYFCECGTGAQTGCVAGDDANRGTAASAPKRSISEIVSTFNAMNPGDTIALCKGGAWSLTAQADFNNARCAGSGSLRTPANVTTCDVRDYPPSWGGTARPIIRQTTHGAAAFAFSNYVQGGIRVLNIDFEGGGVGQAGNRRHGGSGINLAGNSDMLICNNVFNGWWLGIYQWPYSAFGPSSRIDTWGNRFTLNSLDAYLGGGSDSKIEANYFQDNGTYDGLSHTIYPQGMAVSNFSIRNNEIRFIDRTCGTPVISGHDQFDGINIENNYLIASKSSRGCWGFGISGDSGYKRPQYVRNLTMRRNRIEFAGWIALTCSMCPGAVIENNVIVHHASGAASPLISVPFVNADSDDDITANVQIRNNTIYVDGASRDVSAIAIPTTAAIRSREGSGYVIANNAVYFANGGKCWITDWMDASYAFVGNNACFNGTWDNSPASTPIQTNPKFMNAPTDLAPRPDSPLLKAGSAKYGANVDFNSQVRPNPPAIGAYELVTDAPGASR